MEKRKKVDNLYTMASTAESMMVTHDLINKFPKRS
jgi:hypothetical protein